ncbi:MAG: NADH-quinone oxidoreductase subunit D [Rhodobacter sp.]|nr:NADH-quinone oxidoreductase subunit D [Rhodobacter sp.]
MSMVDLTQGKPRSSDGLQMDWIKVPFGPFLSGLPAGLRLTLTLDGDTVAASEVTSLVGGMDLLDGAAVAPAAFVDRLAAMMPLSPVAYRALACAAIEAAAGIEPDNGPRRATAAAIERERIASHLGWLAEFGAQTGFSWLAARAGALQLAARDADAAGLAALSARIAGLIRRVQSAPLLRMRLGGMARIGKDSPASGPVDRARGGGSDARRDDPTLAALGFAPLGQTDGDALARLRLRCDEISQSLRLVAAAGAIAEPVLADIGAASGEGAATVETPRGAARLELWLEGGQVVNARLDAPSTLHLALIEALTAQQELGDALVAVGSLDLSPWEIRA